MIIEKKMKNIIYYILPVLCCLLPSCQPKNGAEEPTKKDTTVVTPTDSVIPSRSLRQEPYRPQVHYTVHHNWMNDPNGLCYKDGVWHLYYQYNPGGIDCNFGAMSWGHAESTDLMHWSEREPVLYPDEKGAMFSGCSVVDIENKAGFGAGAILAYYTASAEKQLICLAVSTDGGVTFQKHAGPYNGAIVNSTGLNNFRDPKVVWDAEHNQYVMVIAKGWDQGLEFWRSTNLLDWSFVPYVFHAEQHRCNLGQYECPDLFYLPIKGESSLALSEQSERFGERVPRSGGKGAWVLILSTMPGGYITGSGTMYFVGTMTPEGYFLADEGDYPQWLDYGADNYAAVSWNNAPDGRVVAIGWMNNWDYAPACPASIWKSAMTLPREYSLRDIDGKLVLCSEPVRELETLAGEWQTLDNTTHITPLHGRERPGEGLDAYELEATISLSEDAAITLSNAAGEQYEVRVDTRCLKIICDRSRSGVTNFTPLFAVPSMSAPYASGTGTLTLRLIVDQSSVELFADEGATTVTNTVYPSAIYDRVETKGGVESLRFRRLSSIWLPMD